MRPTIVLRQPAVLRHRASFVLLFVCDLNKATTLSYQTYFFV